MRLAVIGAGKMASAIVFGILKAKQMDAASICISNRSAEKLAPFQAAGVSTFTDNAAAAEGADTVLLAVKPDQYPAVLQQLATLGDAEKKVYVSIAPGIRAETIKSYFPFDAKVIRTMPNTPALVGEGMTAIYAPAPVSEAEADAVEALFCAFGKTARVTEKQLDASVAVSGSSPAYVFMFIEALADGAVADGIPRDMAYRFAAQAVLGSAKMVLETGKHPAVLKDMVCSPGGTTIEAVKALEACGFRAGVLEAMRRCTEKGRSMGKNK